MKTIRDTIYSLINVYQPYPKLITEHKEAIDQALKETEELLLSNLPASKEIKELDKGLYDSRTIKIIHDTGYNQALEDTRKAFKSIIGGK